MFDVRHAAKVLCAFGQAFGTLPEHSNSFTNKEQRFLTQAVEGLAEEGKVICVRLALFAEMMRSKPWTLASLNEAGGAAGVGVTFLEETFSLAVRGPRASTAPDSRPRGSQGPPSRSRDRNQGAHALSLRAARCVGLRRSSPLL